MPVLLLLIVLFITVPLVELYVLIKVGRELGAATTIGLCVLTAVAGAALIRIQGLATVGRVQAAVEANQLPAVELLAGAMLLATALLLLTPGFITDLAGFLVLVPAIRHWLARAVLARAARGGMAREGPVEEIIEGEYREAREDEDDDGPRRLP